MVRKKQPFQMYQLVGCPLAKSSLCRHAILHSVISRTATIRQEDLTRDSKRSKEQKKNPRLLPSENKFKTMLGSQPPVYFVKSLFQCYLLEIISLDSHLTKCKQHQCQQQQKKAVSLANSHQLQGTHYQWVCGQTAFFEEITIGKLSVHLLWHCYFSSN